MRWILCLSVVFATSIVLAPDADARKVKRGYVNGPYSYGYAAPPYRRGPNTASSYYKYRGTDTEECIRARDVDPSGSYAGYPCWAQYALSPKRRGF
jgi:hypothetical protein